MVSDQGLNIKKAAEIGKLHHLFCFAHKLDLCLTSYGVNLVEDYSHLITKCKDIIKFFRYKSSEVAEKQAELNELFENIIEDDHSYFEVVENAPSTSLKKFCPTRWNTLFTMIESLLINRAVVYDLLRKHGKNDLIFTARQISALKKLLEFLKTFKQATKKLQGERYPTLSLAWPYVCLLKRNCRTPDCVDHDSDYGDDAISDFDLEDGVDESSVSYGLALGKLKNYVYDALETRFPKDDTMLLASNLDPRFLTMRDRYNSVEEYLNGIKIFLVAIKDDFTSYSQPIESNATPKLSAFEQLFSEILDEEASANQQTPSLNQEILAYIRLPRLQSNAHDGFNLLKWWNDHQSSFPILSRIARKVHSIVATSAEAERVFSSCGNIVNQKRSRLLPSNVDKFVFIHANLYEEPEESIN